MDKKEILSRIIFLLEEVEESRLNLINSASEEVEMEVLHLNQLITLLQKQIQRYRQSDDETHITHSINITETHRRTSEPTKHEKRTEETALPVIEPENRTKSVENLEEVVEDAKVDEKIETTFHEPKIEKIEETPKAPEIILPTKEEIEKKASEEIHLDKPIDINRPEPAPQLVQSTVVHETVQEKIQSFELPSTPKEEEKIETPIQEKATEAEKPVIEVPKKEVKEIINEVSEVQEKPKDISSLYAKARESATQNGNTKTQQSLNESLPTKTQQSLNDVFATKHVKKNLADKLKLSPISDLRTAISINQRVAFIKQLFKGDEKEFRKVVTFVNNCRNFSEAKMYLQSEVVTINDWKEDNGLVEEFMELVYRKFL